MEKIESIDSRYIDALKSQKWMGNVRELRNVVERSIIMSNSGELSLETLPLTYVKAESQIDGESMGISSPISDLSLEEIEKNHIKKMLGFTGGNKTEAAKNLGIGVATLYRKMSEYNI
ncbi:MAG: helix-turn-helix domain-containing protein [Bacilli bacterium]